MLPIYLVKKKSSLWRSNIRLLIEWIDLQFSNLHLKVRYDTEWQANRAGTGRSRDIGKPWRLCEKAGEELGASGANTPSPGSRSLVVQTAGGHFDKQRGRTCPPVSRPENPIFPFRDLTLTIKIYPTADSQ